MAYKKAQIKLFESIAVLIVFVFLVAIGMRLYSSIQMQEFEESQEEFFGLNSVKASIIISHLPELTCSFAGTTEAACFDLHKVLAWNELIENQEDLVFQNYYFPILGSSQVTITQIYPETDSQKSWIIYNSTLGESFDFVRIPVIIYNPIDKKNSVGVLEVKTYYG